MSTKIDLDNDNNVFTTNLALSTARNITGEMPTEELDQLIDEAQGHVFQHGVEAFLVIRITPEEI